MSAVNIQGISKQFGGFFALKDVTFDIPTSSVFGLLGPNGAGKTTLFSIAAGFIKPTAGNITLLGDIDVRSPRRFGRLSMLPQDARFQGGIPVIEQLIMFCRLAGEDATAARKSAEKALEIVGLAKIANKAARTLSHGMMKRVALSQAFLGDPEVVFLDEPTAGLDPDNARNIRNFVKEYSKNRTVVFSSHNLQEVQDICSHVCILDHGKVVQTSTMSDLTRTSHLVRIGPNKSLPLNVEKELVAHRLISSIERTGGIEFNVRLDLEGDQQQDEAMKQIYETLFAHGIYPNSVNQGASLEARFLELTGGQYDGASSS